MSPAHHLRRHLQLGLATACAALSLCSTPSWAATFSGGPLVNGVDPAIPGPRLTRDGVPSACGSTKAFPGLVSGSGGGYEYKRHSVNNPGPAQCVSISLTTSSCSGGNALHLTAYSGSFDPSNLSSNYLGDLGGSPVNRTLSMDIEVPANAQLVLVINENDGGSTASTCQYTLSTSLPLAPIVTSSLANGTVGSSYSQALAPQGSTWSSTNLPAGLSLSASGVLSGTPQVAGNFPITFSLSDSSSPTAIESKTLSLNVSIGTPTAPTLGTPTAGNAQASFPISAPGSDGGSPIQSYSVSCQASGGTPVSATGTSSPVLVTGLTNGSTYGCTATATNGANLTSPASAAVSTTLPAIAPTAPTLGTPTAGNAQASFPISAPSSDGGSPIQSYSVSCQASGGTPVSATGASSPVVVTGLTNGSAYSCTTTATNGAALSSPASAAVSVTPVDVLSVSSPATAPAATVGQPYSFTLTASGGVPPYSWAATGLPAGLSLNASTGEISGTPTDTKSAAKAALTVSISLTDSLKTQAQQTLSLTVNAAPSTVTPVPTLGEWALAALAALAAAAGARRLRRRAGH